MPNLCFPWCGRRPSLNTHANSECDYFFARGGLYRRQLWSGLTGSGHGRVVCIYLSLPLSLHPCLCQLTAVPSHPSHFLLFSFFSNTPFSLVLFFLSFLLLFLSLLLLDHSVFSHTHCLGPQGAFIAFQRMCVHVCVPSSAVHLSNVTHYTTLSNRGW